MSAETAPEDLRIDMSAMLGALLGRWLRILVVTILALGTTYAILQFVPKMYESRAGILVEQRAPIASRVPGDVQTQQPSIPVEAMMASQIELIKSRDTLMSVVDALKLREEPEFNSAGLSPIGMVMQLLGRKPEARSVDETVIDNLNERLSVVRERDSAVISVIVRSTNPELAASIANAIADAHVRRRTSLSLSDTAEASAWLEHEIGSLREKVRDAETAVANYRVDNDLYQSANNPSVLDTQLSAMATQITAAQERKGAAQSRANLIRQLLGQGQPIDGVEDVRNSVVIQQLSQNRATLQAELAQRSSTLLGNHPTIRALRAQISEIENQIVREGRRVAEALESQAEIEGNLEASLRADLAKLKQSASTATRDTVTLDGLEREAKAQRDLLESYLLRYSDAIARTGAGSAFPDVRVVTVAAPSINPASPKTALILGAVGFVALALQIGGVLFGELMSGRALTDRAAFRMARATREAEDEDVVEAIEAIEAVAEPEPEPEPVAAAAPAVVPEPQPVPPPVEPMPETKPVAAMPREPMVEAAVAARKQELEARVKQAMRPPRSAKPAVATPAPEPKAAPRPKSKPFSAMTAEEKAEALRVAAELDRASPAAAVAFGIPTVPFGKKAGPGQPARPPAKVIDPSPVQAEEPSATPRPTPKPEAKPQEPDLELENLAADIAIGRVRTVILAGLGTGEECEPIADLLIDDALRRGLSLVLIDAGSGRPSVEPGITDLSVETASFGDVVHRVRDGFAHVPWGQQASLALDSMRPVTLVEALGDIYEVVIVVTGRMGPGSSLRAFGGLPARLVLVSEQPPDRRVVTAAVEEAASLGHEVGQIVRAQRQVEVA